MDILTVTKQRKWETSQVNLSIGIIFTMYDNLFKPLYMGVCTIRYSLRAKLANKTFILNNSDLDKLNQEKTNKQIFSHSWGVE